MLRRLKDKKKGLSPIVAYVLLILMGLGISGGVYAWLKFFIDIEDLESCPEELSLNVLDVKYSKNSEGLASNLTIQIQNRGNFNIDGYLIRLSNIEDSTGATQTLYRNDTSLSLGESRGHFFNETELKVFEKVCFITVQPYIFDSKGKLLPCEKISSRKIDC